MFLLVKGAVLVKVVAWVYGISQEWECPEGVKRESTLHLLVTWNSQDEAIVWCAQVVQTDGVYQRWQNEWEGEVKV